MLKKQYFLCVIKQVHTSPNYVKLRHANVCSLSDKLLQEEMMVTALGIKIIPLFLAWQW
jgi:hypothetical protein